MYRDPVVALRRLLNLQNLRRVHLLRRFFTRLLLRGLCICIANVMQYTCANAGRVGGGDVSSGSCLNNPAMYLPAGGNCEKYTWRAHSFEHDRKHEAALTRPWLVDFMTDLAVTEVMFDQTTRARGLMDLEKTHVLRRADLT